MSHQALVAACGAFDALPLHPGKLFLLSSTRQQLHPGKCFRSCRSPPSATASALKCSHAGSPTKSICVCARCKNAKIDDCMTRTCAGKAQRINRRPGAAFRVRRLNHSAKSPRNIVILHDNKNKNQTITIKRQPMQHARAAQPTVALTTPAAVIATASSPSATHLSQVVL